MYGYRVYRDLTPENTQREVLGDHDDGQWVKSHNDDLVYQEEIDYLIYTGLPKRIY